MPNTPPIYDGQAGDEQTPPELESIERRLVLDATLWELEAPAETHLEEYARQVALLERPPEAAIDTVAGTDTDARLRTLDLGVLEGLSTTRHMTPAPRVRRPRVRLTLAVMLLVAALALSVLARFTVFNPPHHATEPTPTATMLPITTPSATTTSTTPATGAATPGGTGSASAPGDVTQVIVGTGPTTWTDYCDGPRTFNLMATFDLAPDSPAETITYRWLRSDGYVSPVASVQYTPTNPSNVMAPDSTWSLQPAQGDGSWRWVAVEVLSPNAITSAHSELQLTCTWALHDTTATLASGGTGTNPPSYDCQAGGDQTFTFSGVINVDADSQSHTITYHWLRSYGTQTTQGPDQSVTMAPGQLSASVQDDVWVVHQSDPNSTQPYTDTVVVTSSSGVVAYGAQISKSCTG